MAFFKKRNPTKQVPNLPEIDVVATNVSEIKLEPFPHQNVKNFLKHDFYQDVCKYYNEILVRGVLDADAPEDNSRFRKYPYAFDCAHFQIPANAPYPMDQFISQKWIDYFSALFDLPLTNQISLAFHHHGYHARRCSAHTDYCYVGLPKTENPDVNQYFEKKHYYYASLNNIEQGKKLNLDVQMRSCVAMIYVNNPPYKNEHGGETALYQNYQQFEEHKPVEKYPPISNSATLFEVTPNSYHTFLPNSNVFRNLIVLWFHSETDTKIKRFKGEKPKPFHFK